MGKYLVAAASPDLQVANVPYNVEKIKEQMQESEKRGVKITLFPRLCLCGVTCGDLFTHQFLADKCLEGLQSLVDFSKDKKGTFVVGMPMTLPSEEQKEGSGLRDVAVFFSKGEVMAVVPNVCLSKEDKRWFQEAVSKTEVLLFGKKIDCFSSQTFEIDGRKVTAVVGDGCTDLSERLDDKHKPCADLLLHLSSQTERVDRETPDKDVARRLSFDCGKYLSASPAWGESTSWDVYSGRNYYAADGQLLGETKPFSGDTLYVDLCGDYQKIEGCEKEDDAVRATPFIPAINTAKKCKHIFEIQARALAKRLQHAHAKTAVIGVSGGLDSTLALLVTARALDILRRDRKDMVAITMPGFGTTGKTFQNALALIEGLGATSKTIDIQKSVLQHFKDIGHDEKVLNTTYENAQARMRTMILMDVANATGGIVVGTGDLSEAALGWCTYNGDHMSMYSVNATLSKTLIKKVVEVLADEAKDGLKETLLSVLGTEISPELLPPSKDGKIAQKTEELVGPYDLLDFFLYRMIKHRESPKELFTGAKEAFLEKYDDATIKKWLKNFYRRFFTQQFKRSCAPDGANIGVISFAPTKWQMPSDACADIWLKEVEEL